MVRRWKKKEAKEHSDYLRGVSSKRSREAMQRLKPGGRQPLPPRAAGSAVFRDQNDNAKYRYGSTMQGWLKGCASAPVDFKKEWCFGTRNPGAKAEALLKRTKDAKWDTRIDPRYDCTWGDWRTKPTCQKLLATAGIDERSIFKRKERKRKQNDRAFAVSYRKTKAAITPRVRPCFDSYFCSKEPGGVTVQNGRWYMWDGNKWAPITQRIKGLPPGWSYQERGGQSYITDGRAWRPARKVVRQSILSRLFGRR